MIVETKYATIDRDELKRLQKDAGRYRYIRENGNTLFWEKLLRVDIFRNEDIDAAIDADHSEQPRAMVATPAEDGREEPKHVAWIDRSTDNGVTLLSDGMPIELDGEHLMTVTQHERIVAAKDAEIADERDMRRRMAASIQQLKDDAKDQPARQVGGDEREQFEAWIHREWPQAPLSRIRDALPKNDPRYCEYCDEYLQRAWVGWRARAALAQAAVVMPDGEKLVVHDLQEYIHVSVAYRRAIVKAVLAEVARLNRRTIPEGLLKMIETHLELRAEFDLTYPPDTQPLNEDAKLYIELRALLGKES